VEQKKSTFITTFYQSFAAIATLIYTFAFLSPGVEERSADVFNYPFV
jgi:hypothetical protein